MYNKRFLHACKPILNKSLVPLTSTKHREISRSPLYSKLTDKNLDYFKSILSPKSIVYEKDPENLQYNTDFFKIYRGASSLCLFPTSTEQVSKILKYCNTQTLGVVPQGGNTGVSGGCIPVFDEIIINTSKMNRIRHFDEVSGIAVVDAGVVLESLDQYLEPKGYTVPLDLGAKGSCQLGGNVSTNAGGLRLMKFGSLHGNVLGLEVVLPDGTVLDNLSTLRKDNTGYDLKQLFIGAEGTLGIVTAVSLLTPRRPKSTNVAIIALESFDDIQKAFVMAKKDLSEILSAFEFWDYDSVKVVGSEMMKDSSYPIDGKYAFYALLETQGSKQEHDQEKLGKYLYRLLESGVVKDGSIAQDAKQMNAFWSWREKIPESVNRCGNTMPYDVSMDVPLLYKLVEDCREHFGKQGLIGRDKRYFNIVGFGHVGDGNLHIIANVNGDNHKYHKEFDEFVYSWTMRHKGSISAEHGVGLSKVNYMKSAKNPVQFKLMKAIKNTLDPNQIMNPYKVIPDS